jgi:hypothetical protein
MADQSGEQLVQERTLSVPLEDGTLHIQVLELGKQVCATSGCGVACWPSAQQHRVSD